MPDEGAILLPPILRTSASPQGTVVYKERINGNENLRYSEYIYGNYTDVDPEEPLMVQWAMRLISIHYRQQARIENGANIPPFFTRGIPPFVQFHMDRMDRELAAVSSSSSSSSKELDTLD